MVAVAEVHVFHGAAPGTPTDVTDTTIRFKRADNDTQDANNPIPIPTSGTNYSWRKAFKLRCPATGPDNKIENLRLYSELQSLGTGRSILCKTASTYTQGSSGDEGTPLSGSADVDTYTSGSPLVVAAGQVFGAAETGSGTQDFVELQAALTSAGSQGDAAAAKGIVYRYDES
jgi:hypothetical protein